MTRSQSDSDSREAAGMRDLARSLLTVTPPIAQQSASSTLTVTPEASPSGIRTVTMVYTQVSPNGVALPSTAREQIPAADSPAPQSAPEPTDLAANSLDVNSNPLAQENASAEEMSVAKGYNLVTSVQTADGDSQLISVEELSSPTELNQPKTGSDAASESSEGEGLPPISDSGKQELNSLPISGQNIPSQSTHEDFLVSGSSLSAENKVLSDKAEVSLSAHQVAHETEGSEAQPDQSQTIRPVSGLKRIEIMKSRTSIQKGALRPAFHVPHAPRRLSSLQEAVDFSRQLLPMPSEMQLNQKSTQRTWLLAQINHCESRRALSRFAFSLDYKDLSTLFPALATLKGGQTTEKLISIIMMRASRYLYAQGWITLQYAYPRFTVQKGLSELCQILEKQPPMEASQLQSQRDWFLSLHLGSDRFNWSHLPLISEISLPSNRHFIAALSRYIRENGLSGERFFSRYGIYKNLPLGVAILKQWETDEFENQVKRGASALPHRARPLFAPNNPVETLRPSEYTM